MPRNSRGRNTIPKSQGCAPRLPLPVRMPTARNWRTCVSETRLSCRTSCTLWRCR
nr:MAG TPA: hypothetical protein [Caudoviricetes sp.]DAJ80605.1 MAG TPA: hypothetical protein [Caudoviricetes sp.]DAN83358.1 MAG TPA: hypothetical protein [Caudoviricetes sp.]DAR08159.1 MAG TPA: hypothetical protein [Caudoviricetes sp.]DAT59166.1 MAG TPA: hypothetical protein [Caudoviricetes sp.]